MAYQLSGQFVEMCDCFTVCPCWVGQKPTENRCTGAFGWRIEQGGIDGVDLAGRLVVSVSFHSGHRDTGGQEVFLFIDEGATDQQFDLLVRAFTGQLGGPLGELGSLMGVLRASERAAIAITNQGRFASVTVDSRVAGDSEVLVGPDGATTTLEHGRLAVVLGTPAEVGTNNGFRVDLGGQGFSVDVKSRAAMRGTFAYASDGGPA
jgi:hypothetical protein